MKLSGFIEEIERDRALRIYGAILAALNLADELFRIQKRQDGERGEIREKVAALAEELTQALHG